MLLLRGFLGGWRDKCEEVQVNGFDVSGVELSLVNVTLVGNQASETGPGGDANGGGAYLGVNSGVMSAVTVQVTNIAARDNHAGAAAQPPPPPLFCGASVLVADDGCVARGLGRHEHCVRRRADGVVSSRDRRHRRQRLG